MFLQCGWYTTEQRHPNACSVSTEEIRVMLLGGCSHRGETAWLSIEIEFTGKHCECFRRSRIEQKCRESQGSELLWKLSMVSLLRLGKKIGGYFKVTRQTSNFYKRVDEVFWTDSMKQTNELGRMPHIATHPHEKSLQLSHQIDNICRTCVFQDNGLM